RNGQLPLIVFSFSRRESAEMARQLAPAVRLKPGARRLIDDTVREVIQKHLQEPDRQLQSVRECHFLLSRGVGVHHGGLLPVLREITEKLFKDGLVRVLCTTETFAVGVNMPSRSVVFNWPADHEFQKYDGMEQRNILVAEYMQMAGRAGRRNQDKRGNAWNVITRRHPSQRLRALMIGGNIERVESKFRLSWPLMLRCLRSGGSGVLQLLLTQSFRQFLSKMANASVFESELEPKMQVLRAEGLAEGAGLKELGSAAAYIQVAHPALLCFRMLKTDFRALLRADALPTFVAFLSSFANDLEEEEEVATADRFGPYWQWCEDQVPQISETLRACGVMDEVSLGQLRRRAGFVQATYLWMQKENFERCSDAAGGAEYDGILARVLKRTSLLLKQLEMAMALLGLAEQEALLQQARGMLSRGGAAYQSLPFLDSIYLAIAFEPDTLDVSLLRRQQRPCPYPVGAKVELAPSEIGFSHFSISARFKPERGAPAMSIAETLQELLDGKDPESIPEMPVFWTDNQFWTLANRRLATFRLFQQRCGDAARSAKVKVRVAGPEEAEEWGFWWRWTTGLWRGRRAVLRNTSEMIGRTAEETTFRALSSSQDVGEVFAETGYERCPARPRDMCHEEADEMDDTENDTGGGAMGEEEALEMEDFSVALDQQQVSRFLINRELDCTDCAEKPRSSYSVSRPATSRDLIWSAGSDACELSVEDPIPEKFENIHQYLRSFALPMLEELREGLGAALDPAQLNLQQAEAARLHSFQAAKDSKMMGLPPKPAWFKVASSEILLVLTPTGQPCKAARWAPGQMCLLYEEGALQDALALGGGDESADRAPAVQAKPGGCCRFGMIHTTPKSKHALVLVSQRKDLPKVTEREERRVRYQNARDRRADVEVQKGPDGRSTAVRVQQDGAAWRQGLRVGMACKVRRKAKDEEGESDSEEEAQLQAPDAAASAVIFEGKLRLWRLAKLEANVMAQLRVAQAMADPEGHQPIFWQREISGQPDHAASAFGRMAEQKCQAMGEEEFTLEAALNESQEQAVRKLVRCSHGVQLVQGPPGTGKTHTLSVLLQQCALLALGSSSAPGTTPALGDVPSQPPEPRSASGDDGNER
ncbi:unnamed protein product, partial [Effrenium voratum]